MKLTDVEVSRPQIDHTIQVASYFGTRRVVYEIPREPLDDYFPRRPHLTDTERHTLVNSNLKGITTVMQQKNASWRLGGRPIAAEGRFGCWTSIRVTSS